MKVGVKAILKVRDSLLFEYDRAIKRDVIECPVIAVKSSNHPAVYPEFIVQELLNLTSQPNDVVLDPFIGSGTTAVVAKRMGRYYIGFEINPNYCEIARKALLDGLRRDGRACNGGGLRPIGVSGTGIAGGTAEH
jgi:DNA modification methylase